MMADECDDGAAASLDPEQAKNEEEKEKSDQKPPALAESVNGINELNFADNNTEDANKSLDEQHLPNGNKENHPNLNATKRKEKRAQNRKEKKEKKNHRKNDAALFCPQCCCNFVDKSEHIKSEEHLCIIKLDEGRTWEFRPPPKLPSSKAIFKICQATAQGGSCKLAILCPNAHSEAELIEWKERFEFRQMKARKLDRTFKDALLDKLTQASSNLLDVLATSITDVACECDTSTSITLTSKAEKPIVWTFNLDAKEMLQNVTLLSEMSEEDVANYFSLLFIKEVVSFENGEGYIKTLNFPSAATEWSRSECSYPCQSATYKIGVQFFAAIYGTFRQSMVFDFGKTPYLRKDLSIDVKPFDDSEVLEEDDDEEEKKLRELQNTLIAQSERWDKSNCQILDFLPPIQVPNPEDLFLYQAYPTPQPSTFKVSKSVIEPTLTKKNYRSRMHELLFIEEMAQFEQISQFNVQTSLMLISKYLLTPSSANSSTAKYARPGELFGKMSLKGSLSEDTTAGRLILTNNCTSLLLKPITRKGTGGERIAYVAGMEDSGKSSLYLRLSAQLVKDMNLSEGKELQVEVQFQLNRLPLCEMHLAIDRIPDMSLVYPDVNLAKKTSIPWTPGKQWNEDLDTRLNPKQREAILAITSESVSLPPILIIGPFGTGKTFTLAKAIRILLKQEGTNILVCTHSNSAADLYIREYLDPFITANPQVQLLRVYYKNRWVQTVHTSVQKYCLIDDDRTFRNPTKDDVLKCNIVVATLATSRYLSNIGLPIGHFTHILIDEAAQAMECEAIMPLALAKSNKTRIVLAGDHMQLSPEVFSSFARERKFNKSLLERLYDLYPSNCVCKILLCENYRSHEAIISYTSDLFYEQKLLASGKQLKHGSWHPLTVFTARGTDVQDVNSTSFYNDAEVYEVVDRVAELQKTWPKSWGNSDENSIGIVTPYYDQVQRIRSELRKRRLYGVSVERVLNVQGKQFRAIILSTVRTRRTCLDQDGGDFGFLSNAKLLNTAITRAQSLVAVVGDPVALCSIGKCRKLWERFVDISRKHDSLFGTTWNALRAMLKSCDLNKKFILNPLAPEFIPRARRQHEAYLNPLLLALQSTEAYRHPTPPPTPMVPYGFFPPRPAQIPFVPPTFFPPRYLYNPFLIDPSVFPFPPFVAPPGARSVNPNFNPPPTTLALRPAAIPPSFRPKYPPSMLPNPALMPNFHKGSPILRQKVPRHATAYPMSMPVQLRPTMPPVTSVATTAQNSGKSFAFLSDGVHFPPIPSTPPPHGRVEKSGQPRLNQNQNLLDAACKLLPLDIELSMFLKSHDLQMAWFTSLRVSKSEKDAVLFKELIVTMQQNPDLMRDIQKRIEAKRYQSQPEPSSTAELVVSKPSSESILMPSASSAEAFYTFANAAARKADKSESESIVSEMLKFPLNSCGEEEANSKSGGAFCSNGDSLNSIPLYKRRALVASGSSDDSNGQMTFSDYSSDRTMSQDFFDFGNIDRSRSSTMPSADLSTIWSMNPSVGANPSTLNQSSRTYANVLRQQNSGRDKGDLQSDPLLKLRQQGTRGSQELQNSSSENVTQAYQSAFGSKW